MGKTYVIIPARNEEDTIGGILETMQKCVQGGIVDHVVVVNDGSKDNTGGIIRKFADGRGILYVDIGGRKGMGNAIMAGIKKIGVFNNDDVIAKIDADLTGITAEHVRALVTPVKEHDYTYAYASFDRIPATAIRAYKFGGIGHILKKHGEALEKSGHLFDNLIEFLIVSENVKSSAVMVPWPKVKNKWKIIEGERKYRHVGAPETPKHDKAVTDFILEYQKGIRARKFRRM